MVTKEQVAITIDREIIKETRRILKELGLKLSTFTEVMYKALVDSETKPLGEVYGPIFDRINTEINKKGIKKKKSK